MSKGAGQDKAGAAAGPSKEEQPSEMASISVSARIPEFWQEQPRLWFAQFEAIVSPQKQGDEYKYQLAVSKLSRDALQQCSDILYTPPAEGKYNSLKERLLKVYEESPERQFQRLVGEMDLGSQKPTQLLRKMMTLARNCQASDETVHRLWMARLPTPVRAVLTASQDQTLENLGTIADKVVENITSVNEVASVSSGAANFAMQEMMTAMNKLVLEVASLRGEIRGRSQARYQSRGRSASRGRSPSPNRTPESPDWLCRYHFRFRSRATRCEKPCAWKQPAEN